MNEPLASERVIVEAPMSFTGATKRIWRITEGVAGWTKAALVSAVILLLLLVWTLILCWYVLWGLWLVPYRVIRRGSRKRKMENLRHKEMLGAIQQQNQERGS